MKRLLVVLTLLLGGCVSMAAEESIAEYHRVAPTIRVGDSQESVEAKLKPIQDNTPELYQRPPTRFTLSNDLKVEIVYVLASRVADHRQTDDEYVPYTFADGMLIAIGWDQIGGPQTLAREQDRPGAP
jgi:hypothetical protein